MTKPSQTAATTKGESAKARPKLLMVLGMHRSGTSAITKGLEVLGVDLGDNLIPPQEDNPKGFFEDRELIELNERILKKTGHSWYDLAPIDPALMTGPDLLTERLEAGAFIRRKLNASEAVGLKDPRLSILMPFWFDVLQDIDVETGYIIPVRNPLAVARSLLVRDGLMLERGAALWGRYVCDALEATSAKSRIFVDFDKVLDTPVPELARIAKTFGLSMPPQSSRVLKSYTDEFLEDVLRTQKISENQLKRTGLASDIIVGVHEKLLELSALPALDKSVSSNRSVRSLLKRFHGVAPLARALDRVNEKAAEAPVLQQAHDLACARRDEALAKEDKALKQREALQQAHDLACGQRDEALAKVDKALKQREALQQAHDLACAQRDEALAKAEDQRGEIYRLQSTLSKQRETLKSELQRETDLRRAREAEIRSLRAIARHEAETAEFLRGALEQARANINQYRTSTSWKVTAPLRSVVRLFRTHDSRMEHGRRHLISAQGLTPIFWRIMAGRAVHAKRLPPPALPPRAIATGGEAIEGKQLLLAIVIHAYYPELLPEILERLSAEELEAKLYVTTSPPRTQDVLAILEAQSLPFELIETENRGRDIAPFLIAMKQVNRDAAQLVLKLHTKKSTHLRNGETWRNHLYESLLGFEAPERAIETFKSSPDIGLLAPDGHVLSTEDFSGSNDHKVMELLQRLGVSEDIYREAGFVAGSMFYARREVFNRLTDQIIMDEFEVESGQMDGTMAHAIERLFGALAVSEGYRVASLGGISAQTTPLSKGSYQFL